MLKSTEMFLCKANIHPAFEFIQMSHSLQAKTHDARRVLGAGQNLKIQIIQTLNHILFTLLHEDSVQNDQTHL